MRLQVLGPIGHHVSVCIELLGSADEKLITEQVASLSLPITSENWGRAFAGFSRREPDPWAYLAASSGNLVVQSDELGTYRIPLQRNVAPVRWVWHKSNRGTALRLINDHEGDEPL